MRLIIDITNTSPTTPMESSPKAIHEMDEFRDTKIRPRKPLANHAWEFNVFYNPNLQSDQTAAQQEERRKQKLNYLNEIQHQKLYSGAKIINIDDGLPPKYPISMIRPANEQDVTKTKKSLRDMNQKQGSCKKYFGKLYQGIDEYFDSTTLHGLKYVGDSNLSIVERLFWLGAFLSGCCFAIYFIVSIYDKFNTSPMVISFDPKLARVKDIPFPAITICNVNLALKSKFDQIEKSDSSIHKSLLADLCNSKPNHNHNNNDNATKDWEVVKKFIIEVNQKCDDMIKLCKWNGTDHECSKLINPVLTDEGYCCSFNSLPLYMLLRDNLTDIGYFPPDIINWNPEDGYGDTPIHYYPYRSEGQGQALGLTLLLDAQLNEYSCTSTNSIGFKILLSNPTERPKIAEVGFLLAPGDETRISILPDVREAVPNVRNIPIEKRQCFFTRERHLRFYNVYSEKNCRLECQANYTYDRCNCVPFYLPRLEGTPICDKEMEQCSNDAKNVIDRFTPERTMCHCVPSCNDVSYKTDSMSIGKITSKHVTASEDLYKNVTYKYFAENMALVHFYFESDKFTKQTKAVMYGFSEFLSNTGGLLGLFLGFSFLSAVEIVYFIFFRAPLRFLRNYRQNNLKEKDDYVRRISNMPYI